LVGSFYVEEESTQKTTAINLNNSTKPLLGPADQNSWESNPFEGKIIKEAPDFQGMLQTMWKEHFHVGQVNLGQKSLDFRRSLKSLSTTKFHNFLLLTKHRSRLDNPTFFSPFCMVLKKIMNHTTVHFHRTTDFVGILSIN
jgi:hypothetical protein